MPDSIHIRPIQRTDYAAWRPLWDAYNAFYKRTGPTALPESITAATWERFFDPAEPMFAVVAEEDGRLVGIVHYLFHRSTTRLAGVCYLQDLYTVEDRRGAGIGGKLINAVYGAARAAGSSRVYWQTQRSNSAGRRLYDQVANHDDAHGFIVYAKEL